MLPSIVRHLTLLGVLALVLAPTGCLAAERLAPSATAELAITKQTPELPTIARQLKLSGMVEVEVSLSEDGSIEKVDIVRGNPVLAKAAQDCVKKWKFKPYKQGDTAVKAVGLLSFSFK